MKLFRTPLNAALLVCAWFSQCALAQSTPVSDANRCSEAIVKRVGKYFHLSEFAYPSDGMYPSVENGGLIVAGVCKDWPRESGRVIAAFAYDAGVEYEKKLLIAVLDVTTKKVIAAYSGAIPEDATTEVDSYSLKLDVAPYILSASTRAFGLRLSTFRERCSYEGGFGDELILYVVDDKAIRPVLSETMAHWRYARGNRCGGEDVARVDGNIVISVEPSSTHGFFDLRFTARSSDNRKSVSAKVKYNGDHYDLQPWRDVFGAWWDAAIVEDSPAVLLADAIGAGDIEQVRKIIAKGIDLDANDNPNSTPLQIAASLGKKEMVRLLIDSGADVNGSARLGGTPLGAAAENGFLDVVELLLSKGADINRGGYLKSTPLHLAATAKQSKMVALLLSEGANVNKGSEAGVTPFHYAAMAGDVEIMEMMIAKGADIAARDQRGLTPLHMAVYCGNRAAIELLIAKHADIDAQDTDLLTPLHWAASAGCTEAVEVLLKRGADSSAANWQGETPLQLAIKYNKAEVAKILGAKSVLASGALRASQREKMKPLFEAVRSRKLVELRVLLSSGISIDTKFQGHTLLHEAIAQGDKDMVSWLLAKGAKPNSIESRGLTPLHSAVIKNRLDLVELLLSRNTAISPKSNDGSTPLHLAVSGNNEDIAKYLIAKGAEVNAKDVRWSTPLHYAASLGGLNMVKLLLANKADVKAQDQKGSTPLHDAVNSDNTDIAKLLLESGSEIDALSEMGTALHVAVSRVIPVHDNLDMVNLLIAKGVGVNVKNANGLTALQSANSPQPHLIKVLKAHGAK
ncbi:ankyrin repeat domain-containing protein [Azonexus sp.]|uniref:ankyrin repeat domain-containing protein n=1 Tax=Azonexus sp. TaxID=1872668 RepID=UPI0035B309F4